MTKFMVHDDIMVVFCLFARIGTWSLGVLVEAILGLHIETYFKTY